MSTPIHVLFIEDNPGDARLISEELRYASSKASVHLESVDRLEKGLQYLRVDSFDAVLLDLSLPDSTGIETLQRVVLQAPQIPVVVMTGMADEETAMLAVQSGAQDYLIKGQVDGRLLTRAIQYAIQRKRIEEALRESEERFRLVVQCAPNAMVVVDERGRITLANTSTETLFGYNADELFGQPVEILVPQHFREAHAQVHQDYLTQPQAMAIGLRHGLHGLHKDGHEIALEIGLAPYHSSEGLRVLALIYDITERKKAEEYIRYQARLLENVSDAIIASDMDGNITSWNTAAQDIYGWRTDEVIGGFVNDFLRTEYMDGGTQDQAFQRFLEAGQWKGEVTQKRKDGERITVLASVSLMRDPAGNPIAMLAVNRDISARKRAEEELRTLLGELEQRVLERTAQLNQTNRELEHASRTKDEFLANMSHELRTPLNSILGVSEMLLEEKRGLLNDFQRRSLELVENSGHHLLELINDILDLSKIEAGKLDYYPQPVDVDEVCRSSLALIKGQAVKKSITVTYTNRSGVPRILADARHLKQVLMNLLANAVKFTPEKGEVTLQVSTDPEQELIRFSVIDTGIGITQEDLQKLFQPFVQIDSRLNRQYEGTGLGLALVRRLVDLHGGSVHVESEPGRGSRFTVNLSCKREDMPAEETSDLAQTPAVAAETSALQGRILLAEDNPSGIMTISEYLQSYGYEVLVAHDGLEAIALAQEAEPDLILMDIQMPAMNGLDAIAHLRANPQFAATPIIAITAIAMSGDRERCLRAGASEYMSKPVSLKALRQRIENFLNL